MALFQVMYRIDERFKVDNTKTSIVHMPNTLRENCALLICKEKLYTFFDEIDMYIFKLATKHVLLNIVVHENLRWSLSDSDSDSDEDSSYDKYLGYGPMGPCGQKQYYNYYELTPFDLPTFQDRRYISEIYLTKMENNSGIPNYQESITNCMENSLELPEIYLNDEYILNFVMENYTIFGFSLAEALEITQILCDHNVNTLLSLRDRLLIKFKNILSNFYL